MSNNAKELLHQLTTPEDLRRLLDVPGIDRPTVIEQFFTKAGSDVVLDQVFGIMATRFKPGPLRTGVLQWEVTAPDGLHIYQLHLTASGGTASRGAEAKARTIISLSALTLLRLCSGRVNAVSAFTSAQLWVRGNLLFAALLPLWFDY